MSLPRALALIREQNRRKIRVEPVVYVSDDSDGWHTVNWRGGEVSARSLEGSFFSVGDTVCAAISGNQLLLLSVAGCPGAVYHKLWYIADDIVGADGSSVVQWQPHDGSGPVLDMPVSYHTTLVENLLNGHKGVSSQGLTSVASSGALEAGSWSISDGVLNYFEDLKKDFSTLWNNNGFHFFSVSSVDLGGFNLGTVLLQVTHSSTFSSTQILVSSVAQLGDFIAPPENTFLIRVYLTIYRKGTISVYVGIFDTERLISAGRVPSIVEVSFDPDSNTAICRENGVVLGLLYTSYITYSGFSLDAGKCVRFMFINNAYAEAYLFESIYYDKVISGEELTGVRSYLASKYALSA